MGRMVDIDRAEMFAQKLILMGLNEDPKYRETKTVLRLIDDHSERVLSLGKFYMNVEFYQFAYRRLLEQSDDLMSVIYYYMSIIDGDFGEIFSEYAELLLDRYLIVNRYRGFVVYCLMVSRLAVIAHQHSRENVLSLAVTAIMDAIKVLDV